MADPARRARAGGDEGSALMLMPAVVLVVLLLGAITVDLAVVHLGQRSLLDRAASAADDAVAYAVDPDTVRAGGGVRFDAGRARTAVERSLAANLDHEEVVLVAVDVSDAGVTVVLEEHIDHVFAKAVPGAPDGTTLRAEASAAPVQR